MPSSVGCRFSERPTAAKTRLERALESLERNVRSQARVIEDLLDVSRMVTGKLQVKMDVVDLCAVLAAAVDAVKPTATAKSLQLALELPATPVSRQCRPGALAAGRLESALQRGEVHPLDEDSSTSRCRPPEEDYVLSVRDSGHRHYARVSALRIRPLSAGRWLDDPGSTGGLGLGLAIVKEVTELHNGSVKRGE